MKLLHKSILYGAFVTVLASCSSESPFGDGTPGGNGTGSIKLNLTSSSEVNSAIPQVRAEETPVITCPKADEFSIRLSKSDGSYSKTWANLTEFSKETEFPIGKYIIEAFHGNENSQGIAESLEDYTNAFYYAKEEVIVNEKAESPVNLHAILSNAILKVEYTESFKNYFNTWSTTLQSEGCPAITLDDAETLSYIIPGTVEVIITAEAQNGKELTLNPANLVILPQYLYRIKYNVNNGEIGQMDQLEISFVDDVDEVHKITIDLTEELLNSVSPIVTPEGFADGEVIETQSGIDLNHNIRFNILASNEIAEAHLTISSQTYRPSFMSNGVIDLCAATEEQQNQMEAAGIKVLGLYNNPGKMAYVDLSGLCKNLPVGNHEISLVVKDKKLKTNEPIGYTVSSLPLNISVEPLPAFFGQDFIELNVSYDGPDPTLPGNNPFTFKVRGIWNWEECDIISINDEPYSTRTFESHVYTYKLRIPEIDRDELPVQIYLNNVLKPELNTNVIFKMEEYEVEADHFATKMRIRIAGEDDVKKENVMLNKIRVFVNDTETKNIQRDLTNRFITISGLKQGDKIKTSLESKDSPDFLTDEITFDPEEVSQVPNGDFETLNSDPFINRSINQGGPYGGLLSANYDTETYTVFEPSGNWATVNQKTCNYSNSGTQNTWFLVPSTLDTKDSHTGDNAMLIRNVGYNLNGTSPGKTSTRPNLSVPSQGSNAAGKLFLGDYSIQIKKTSSWGSSTYTLESETYNQGIEFKSRPSKLTGWYKYSVCNADKTDKGLVLISIEDNQNRSISSATLELDPVSNWTKFEIDLLENGYLTFGEKASILKIMISSSHNASENWVEENEKIQVETKAEEEIRKFLGSELIIDDFQFEY